MVGSSVYDTINGGGCGIISTTVVLFGDKRKRNQEKQWKVGCCNNKTNINNIYFWLTPRSAAVCLENFQNTTSQPPSTHTKTKQNNKKTTKKQNKTKQKKKNQSKKNHLSHNNCYIWIRISWTKCTNILCSVSGGLYLTKGIRLPQRSVPWVWN